MQIAEAYGSRTVRTQYTQNNVGTADIFLVCRVRLTTQVKISSKSRTDSYALSPRILLASWMSLGIMVTLLAWMAQRLVSSKSPTRYASLAS